MNEHPPEPPRFFRGDHLPHPLRSLPPAPPWRDFRPSARKQRGASFRVEPDSEAVELVNAALLLRRPLLITGKPGTGKSSLAHAVAHELKLGPVLVWPITSRSTLQQGLYTYDAVARLQEAALQEAALRIRSLGTPTAAGPAPAAAPLPPPSPADVGRFIRLGPLGTALLPWKRPRVLLIDEIDKSDIDLPNDLLHVFEEGEYEIPELARLPDETDDKTKGGKVGEPIGVPVWRYKSRKTATIRRGRVRCRAFPLVILTSNEEREFPPAFVRRCLRLDLKPPKPDELAEIVASHLEPKPPKPDELAEIVASHLEPDPTYAAAMAVWRDKREEIAKLRQMFLDMRDGQNGQEKRELATDQLLNAVYLLTKELNPLDRDQLKKALFRSLTGDR